MSLQEDVLKIGKKLDNMASLGTGDQAAAVDILEALKKMPITLDILQKTRIGLSVNNFRKTCRSEEIVGLAKALIRTWKKIPSEGGGDQSQPKTNSKSSLAHSGSASSVTSYKDDEDVDSNEAIASDTDDPVRLKCREHLAKALNIPPLPPSVLCPDAIGAAIEHSIYEEFKNTEMKYKNRVRSRVANLKDSKNPSLRENVLRGLIPVDRIACMTAEEMANDDMRELRAKFTKEAINDHQLGTRSASKSVLFICGRCGKRDTNYNQVQTLASDEPMTTFVVCNVCGNRWKFY